MVQPWACAWHSHARARGLFTARVYYWQTCPPGYPDFSEKLAKKNLTEKGGSPPPLNGPKIQKFFAASGIFFGVFHPKKTVFDPKS